MILMVRINCSEPFILQHIVRFEPQPQKPACRLYQRREPGATESVYQRRVGKGAIAYLEKIVFTVVRVLHCEVVSEIKVDSEA